MDPSTGGEYGSVGGASSEVVHGIPLYDEYYFAEAADPEEVEQVMVDGKDGSGGKTVEQPAAGGGSASPFGYLQRFTTMGYQDVWAALLFIVVIAVSGVWGVASFSSFDMAVDTPRPPHGKGSQHLDVGNLFHIATVAVSVSCLGGVFSLLVLLRWAQELIYIAATMSAVVSLAIACDALVGGSALVGVLFLFMAVLDVWWIYVARARIPLSAQLLVSATTIIREYPATIASAAVSLVATCAAGVLCVVSVYAPVARAEAQAAKTQDQFLVLLAIFSFFWTEQVIQNVLHVTVSGVAATRYFAGRARMPQNPTRAAAVRAATYSFGSICLGSLLASIVQLLYFVARSVEQEENSFASCVVACLLDVLARLVRYFNRYAFVHIAIYGCDYKTAAERTWRLAEHSLFAAAFNDALVRPALLLLAAAMSAVVGAVTGLLLGSAVGGWTGFVFSLVCHAIVLECVQSAVTTIFVCSAEAPHALANAFPALRSILTME